MGTQARCIASSSNHHHELARASRAHTQVQSAFEDVSIFTSQRFFFYQVQVIEAAELAYLPLLSVYLFTPSPLK